MTEQIERAGKGVLKVGHITAPAQTDELDGPRTTVLGGRHFIVTGGSAGIGLGLAVGAARAGAIVSLWARDEERLGLAKDRLAAMNLQAATQVCDISDERAVRAALDHTIADLGHVDGVIANAGVTGLGATSPAFVDVDTNEWRRVLNVNLDGTYFCLREVAQHLIDRNVGGSLLTVSSMASQKGLPGHQHYAASKAAVIAMSNCLAVELGRYRIRSNALMPGFVATQLMDSYVESTSLEKAVIRRTPVGRWGTAADCARIAPWLLDPDLYYHTGDTIKLDGGYSLSM